MKKSISVGIVLAAMLFAFASHAAVAEERSYHYNSIKTTLTVQPDSTVDVVEEQTYSFVGSYHLGWRGIADKGIGAITDIYVTDQDGKPLSYTSSRLNKEDPSSWNKYTVYEEDNVTNIEWYYNLGGAPTATHTWTLHYTVHGALGFYKDHDELYWNLFTSYTVPVDFTEATITLPSAVTTPSQSMYLSVEHPKVTSQPTDKTFYFSASNIGANEAVTIAAGWQKGLIQKGAYWKDFVYLYWQILISVLLIVFAIIFTIFYWWRRERKYKGRGTIIAQYDPPQNLRPAMAEFITKGRITMQTWPATVIDLAVRGYVTIEEKESKGLFGWGSTKDYIVTKIKEEDTGLEEFEKDFLEALFPSDSHFSTKEVKGSMSKQNALSKAFRTITKTLYKETDTDTKAFAIPPGKKMTWHHARFVAQVFIALVLLGLITALFITPPYVVLVALLFVILLPASFIAFKTTLNTKGHILREEWLGFKLFLQVTGKDRMQNLTPDMFEKFLPYAMIFGVEKQWAKKFDAFNLPPPQWYMSGAYVGNGSQAGGFSPSEFASGFSASFASSFASSGAGGAGGGGSAGGGGGGGGGGAS